MAAIQLLYVNNTDHMDVRVNEVHNMLREVTLLGQFSGELSGLCFGGDLASEEKPEHTLGNNLLALWCRSKHFLALWDGHSMETDALRKESG